LCAAFFVLNQRGIQGAHHRTSAEGTQKTCYAIRLGVICKKVNKDGMLGYNLNE